MSILAIDAGTTGVTAVVVDADGRITAAATRSSPSTSRSPAGSSTRPRRSGRPRCRRPAGRDAQVDADAS